MTVKTSCYKKWKRSVRRRKDNHRSRGSREKVTKKVNETMGAGRSELARSSNKKMESSLCAWSANSDKIFYMESYLMPNFRLRGRELNFKVSTTGLRKKCTKPWKSGCYTAVQNAYRTSS